MSGSNFPNGPLRLVIIAVTLVAIVAIATVGYSLYQLVFASDPGDSPVFSENLNESMQLVNSTLVFSANGTFPNEGLYTVQYALYINATTPDGSLANVTSPVQVIAPGQTKDLNFTFSLDLFSSGGPAADALFYNGSDVQLSVGAKTSLPPLVSVRVSQNSTTPIPPFLGGLRVVGYGTSGTPTSPGNSTVTISFSDQQGTPISYQIYGTLQSGDNSSIVTGTALPGKTSMLQLEFTDSQADQQSQFMSLHTLAFGHDFVTRLEVVQPA